MNAVKLFSVLLVVLMVMCAIPIAHSEAVQVLPAVNGSWTQSTDADFNKGSFIGGNLTLKGTGASSSVVLRKDSVWKPIKSSIMQPGPPGYIFHALSFDERASAMVLFGGSSMTSGANKTWVYDASGNRWTERLTVNGPAARYGHAMVYVPTIGASILFGGFLNTTDAPNNETWRYDISKNQWMNVTPVHSPPVRGYHAIVYDSYRNVVILFGGTNTVTGSKDFNDTWELNPITSVWTGPIPCGKAPTQRNQHGMAYNPSDHNTWLFGGYNKSSSISLSDTWIYNAAGWSLVTTAKAPQKRSGHAMAYDGKSSKVIVFGGNDIGTILGDLWFYDPGKTWTQVNMTPPYPPGTDKCKMIYDSVNSVCLMFGGMLKSFVESKEVWALDGADWRWSDYSARSSGGGDSILLVRGPTKTLSCVASDGVYLIDIETNVWTKPFNGSIRNSAAAIYSPIKDSIILFGGEKGAALFNSTLAFNFTSKVWEDISPVLSPPMMRNHTMFYDETNHIAVVFGGWGATGHLSETWQFDVISGKWLKVLTGTPPEPRQDHAMVCIPGSNKAILFGGYSDIGLLNDTYIYDTIGKTWRQVPSPIAPSKRAGPCMVYDSVGKRILLFGGKTSNMPPAFAHDLWEFNVTTEKWSLLLPALPVIPRWKAASAFCDWNGAMVVAHGEGPMPLDDMWVFPAYRDRGAFESSRWDTGMSVFGSQDATMLNPGLNYRKVWWNSTGPFGTIMVQLRTAATKDGLNSSLWYGPMGKTDYYVIPGTDINSVHKDMNGRWIQYRLLVNATSSGSTPQLEDITITYEGDYVVPMMGISFIPILCTVVLFLVVSEAAGRKKSSR